MRRIELDFYRVRTVRNRAAGWVWLAIGLALVSGLVSQNGRLQTEQQHIMKMAAQRHERQQKSAARMDDREMTPQLQRAAAVIAQLAFPWDALFRALESSMNDDVALLAVVPDVKGGTITLNGEARDWNAMLDYVRRLGAAAAFFSEVHLVSHQIQQSDPQHPVRFVLLCTWSQPASSAEGRSALPELKIP